MSPGNKIDYCLSGRLLWRNVIYRAQLEASGDYRIKTSRLETFEGIQRAAREWLTRLPSDHAEIRCDILRNCRPDLIQITCSCGAKVVGYEAEVDDLYDEHRLGIQTVWEMAEMPMELGEFVEGMRRRYAARD